MKLEELIDSLPENEKDMFLAEVEEYKSAIVRERSQASFME